MVGAKRPRASKAKEKPVAFPKAKPGKPATIDEYLAALDEEKRDLLEDLRRMIKRVLPDAAECISYSIPAFRAEGRVVAGFAATAAGGSYYPHSGTTLGALAEELRGYSTTKSAVHFTREKPLGLPLVRKLIQARLREL